MTIIETKEDHGINNAIAWYQSIQDLTARLRTAEDAEDYDSSEEIRTEILESVLSVEVRSGWYLPGSDLDAKAPEEYSILLTTGGPALRLIGTINGYGEPETARLEAQDWGTPWADVSRNVTFRETIQAHDDTGNAFDWETYDNTLLAFARCFYLGE